MLQMKMLLEQLQFGIFFAMSSTPQGDKTHLSNGHDPHAAIDNLEVCFYLKRS